MNLTKFFVDLERRRRLGHPRRQQGVWIGPALGTIVIVAVVSAAVFGIFRYINNEITVYVENNQLMTILSGSRQLKSGGSFLNVDNAALQRIEAFGSMTGGSPGGEVRNGWNGTVVVTGTASQLTIQYNGVPAKACDGFLAKAVNSGEFADPLPSCGSGSGTTNMTFIAY